MNPFIAIGQALQQRGHNVTLVTSNYFDSTIRQAGLNFIPVGSREAYLEIIENPDLWHPQKSFRFFAEKAVLPYMRPLYEVITEFDPIETILVAQGQAFGAYMAYEKKHYPYATVQLQPAAFRTVFDMPLLPGWMPPLAKHLVFNALDSFLMDKVLAPQVNAFRAELGLSSVSHIFATLVHSPQRTIGLFPEWFAAPQPDWPPQTILPGFVYYDQDSNQAGEAELRAFLDEGEAPIVFTPGTAMQHEGDFFEASIEACELMGRRGILLSKYREQIPAELPTGIKYFDYALFSELLPCTAAIVHHGGVGTLAQALWAGIPQLIRPMAHDQPENAARLKNLGVAASLPQNQYRGPKVAEVLERLINDAIVAAECRTLAGRIDGERALEETCLALEALPVPACSR